jgi:hypothetical protein
MAADDDGVVEAFTVMRFTGATQDDLRVLVDKGFITVLNDDLVSFINDWKRNNLIKKDRYHESVYAHLLEPLRNPSGTQMEPEVRLGKDSIGKVKGESKSSSRMTRPTIEEVQAYITEKGYHVDAQRFIDYYESNGWKVGRNPMKDWKATVRTWENRDKQDKKNNAPANNKKFRNFEEREYDYDSLEKQLLSKRRG